MAAAGEGDGVVADATSPQQATSASGSYEYCEQRERRAGGASGPRLRRAGGGKGRGSRRCRGEGQRHGSAASAKVAQPGGQPAGNRTRLVQHRRTTLDDARYRSPRARYWGHQAVHERGRSGRVLEHVADHQQQLVRHRQPGIARSDCQSIGGDGFGGGFGGGFFGGDGFGGGFWWRRVLRRRVRGRVRGRVLRRRVRGRVLLATGSGAGRVLSATGSGAGSVATGSSATGSGAGSVATGSSATGSGVGSVATGSSATGSGAGSVATGSSATGSGVVRRRVGATTDLVGDHVWRALLRAGAVGAQGDVRAEDGRRDENRPQQPVADVGELLPSHRLRPPFARQVSNRQR